MIIPVNPHRLYEGCMFAAIVHAVTAGEYPELSYEHSWDGYNYSMNNSQGCRATITFHPKYIVAVFQESSKCDLRRSAYDDLTEMPEEILEIARSEALMYVRRDREGEAVPVITAAFWGTWEELRSGQTWEEIVENGGHIIERQLMGRDQAWAWWDDYYGLNNSQMDLIASLYKRKMENHGEKIYLLAEEMDFLCGDPNECLTALRELDIFPYANTDGMIRRETYEKI